MTSPSILATSDDGRWVSGSTVRGTWDIISLCYSTILICLYSVMQAFVPLEKFEERTFMKKLGGNLIPVARFLLFPEYTPSVATIRLRAACALHWRMEQIGVWLQG